MDTSISSSAQSINSNTASNSDYLATKPLNEIIDNNNGCIDEQENNEINDFFDDYITSILSKPLSEIAANNSLLFSENGSILMK